MEAAAFVDAQVAAFAHRIGVAALERLVLEAIARFMPEKAAEDAEAAAERRHFDIDHTTVSFDGTVRVEGELDIADALDLDDAVARGAETLRVAGSAESLDVRRSMALGEMARHQLALELASCSSRWCHHQEKPRQVVLYVHLSEDAINGGDGCHLARVENRRHVVTADQVRTWCANPDTEVVVKPVIDLAEHIHVNEYAVPERLQEQVDLRDHTCVFPWCTRPARKADHDHVIPYEQGGTTSSDNIAPLCRRHHRLKTHATWRYTMIELGTFLWTSPHGYQFLRDHHGTLDVTRDTAPARPVAAPPRTPPYHTIGGDTGMSTGPARWFRQAQPA